MGNGPAVRIELRLLLVTEEYAAKIAPVERAAVVRIDQREVMYVCGELDEVALAYAITVHKSQGSEFPVVVILLAMQHYLLLQRNLVYTGITQGRKRVVLIGQKKALAMAVRNNRTERRFWGCWRGCRRVGTRWKSVGRGSRPCSNSSRRFWAF